MFILKSVSTGFDKYFFLNNNQLISEVIHGYLLVCDLSDFKSVVAEGLEKRDQTHKQLKASLPDDAQEKLDEWYGTKIEENWQKFQEKLNTIDNRLGTILSHLERDPVPSSNRP